MEEKASLGFILGMIIGTIVTGTINTIGAKAQLKVVLKNSKEHYEHPYFQAMSPFFGMFPYVFIFFFIQYRDKEKYGNCLSPAELNSKRKGLSVIYNPLWFGFPIIFSTLSNILLSLGINNIQASIYQITMCTMLPWATFFSYIFLKKRYTVAQYFGIVMMILGISMVGFNSIMYDKTPGDNNWFGITCVTVSMLFYAAFFIAEEKLIRKFHSNPFQIIGIEGAFGIGSYTIILIILYFIKCTPDKSVKFCKHGRIEDTPIALSEIIDNPLLAMWVIITITSIGGYNGFGISLTKYASAVHRVAINTVRPFAVWIVCLLIGWEDFSWLQLFGFLITMYGMMLYYDFIPMKIWEVCTKKKESKLIKGKP